eukprot:gene5547-6601_t
MDVEPMGPEFVRSMCHDIEDPTFDATAVATNPRAQVRPVHRPPRMPADRNPHCAWTVIIDDAHPPVTALPAFDVVSRMLAASVSLDPIDPTDEGMADYAGPLLDDVDLLLEVSPSPQTTPLLGRLGARTHLKLDLGADNRRVDVLGSLTDVPLADDSVDLLVCYHVL